ncbi:low affinity immunoglobulin gamma Fc region receptor II-like isoform X2 [Micropterus salmoides]|uniref:low affinity immunoglobulin gamma Fc region receptor II-like isoform X2 n=1 Tax=Micropterus salmoides TaxID=27706 RepID=UPI0018EE397B|nr:low affinity immunoglobulin gamma Fc region receptor II-like isoform X2 [Micropterus salmoides]
MKVRALCIRLLMNVLFLLCEPDQKVVSLHVVPNSLQFFEYDAVTFHCDGYSVSTAWKLVHRLKGEALSCRTTSKVTTTEVTCTIKNVYPDDSGEYWCETGEEKRSNSVNITVTAGSVILESPALPVMEGEALTLQCRDKKKTSSNLTADFYKDGRLIRSSSTGNMTIHSVSVSDEGLYKCIITDVGESAESWLAVREKPKEPTSLNPSSSSSNPWIIVTVLLLILLFVVGLHHFGKGYWHRAWLYLSTLTLGSGSAEDRTECAAEVTYAVVTKNKRMKDRDELSCGPVYYTLSLGDTQQLEPGVSCNAALSFPSEGVNPLLTEDALYSTVP